MKSVAKIFSALAIMILLINSVEAADFTEKTFIRQATFTPPRLRQPFPRTFKAPRKDYPSRVPSRPTPHYRPNKPKVSRDNRGIDQRKFGIPRSPRR